MLGSIRVIKNDFRGEPLILSFVDFQNDTSYKVARNFNWHKLKVLDQEVIEAWGQVYYEATQSKDGRYKTFYITKFIVKRDGISNEVDLDKWAPKPFSSLKQSLQKKNISRML